MTADTLQRFSVTYVMDEASHDAFAAYAETSFHSTAQYVNDAPVHALGLNSCAHVTLVQMECAASDVFDKGAWLAALAAALPRNMPMTYSGLYLKRSQTDGDWCGIEIAHNTSLWDAAAKAVEITKSLMPAGASIRNKVGDAYFPHITLSANIAGSFGLLGTFPMSPLLPTEGQGRLAWNYGAEGWPVAQPIYLD